MPKQTIGDWQEDNNRIMSCQSRASSCWVDLIRITCLNFSDLTVVTCRNVDAPSHTPHTLIYNPEPTLWGIYLEINSASFLASYSTWQQLAWAIFYHERERERGLHFLQVPPLLLSIPSRMFIAQKIISLVILAPFVSGNQFLFSSWWSRVWAQKFDLL